MEKLKRTRREVKLLFDIQKGRKTITEKEAPLVVELCLQVHEFSKGEATESTASGCIFSILKKEVETDYDTSTMPDESNDPSWKQVCHSVLQIMGYVNVIEDTKICVVVQRKSSAVIKINCFSSDAVENLLKMLISGGIKEEVLGLRDSLNTYGKWHIYDIGLSCTPECLNAIRKRLEFSSRSDDRTCAKHQGMKIKWYCQEENAFCCKRCKEVEHKSCIELMPFEGDKETKRKSLTDKRQKVEHNVRLEMDAYHSNIHGSCVMPDGSIILLDNGNGRLKKLSNGYKLVSHCDLPDPDLKTGKSLYDVCYIGNERVAISMCNSRILFVNASGDMELDHEEKFDHECFGLACYGGILYVTDGSKVYSYSTEWGNKRELYKREQQNFLFQHIAVSGDGEKIYIAATEGGLVTINNKGQHLCTLKSDILPCAKSVCVFGNGTVLVGSKSGSHSVLQVGIGGDRILGTDRVRVRIGVRVRVITRVTDNIQSLCFNRHDSGLIIGLRHSDNVIVYS
ncbi:uncharacterized protein LOC128551276 [Mercenaria mercenaria]|uniref:uncharacterized protein LOC128551276 n=1 Tax=Mercenaria mercenaria TaxID=6596 RepID=UPI00234F1A67|nr:uncharacterized protein LOC128551276 [Mercenaria mercenaria]